MWKVKIEGSRIKVIEEQTSLTKLVIDYLDSGGVKFTDISGDWISVSCLNGKFLVYDISTGKRII